MLIIPHAATVLMLNNVIRQEHTLRLYTNDVKPTPKSTRGDFSEIPTGKGGYQPVKLVPAQWQIDAGKVGEVPVALYPKVTFTFTEGIGKVFGYFVTASNGSLEWVEWFEDGPYEMKHEDDEIKVRPRFGATHGTIQLRKVTLT